MGRFSCFYAHVPSLKQKKSAPPSFDSMMKTLQLGHQNHTSTSTVDDLSLPKFRSVKDRIDNLGSGPERGNLRKSLSVGCELDKQSTFSYDNVENEIVCDSSYEGSHETIEDISLTNDAQNHKTSMPDHDREALDSLSRHSSSLLVNHDSVFTVDQQHNSNKVDQEDPHLSFYAECQDDSGRNTPTQSRISKCYSMPNFGSTSPRSGVSACDVAPPLNSSFEDLNILSITKENVSTHNVGVTGNSGQNEPDNYVPYNYGSNKDWIIPMPDEIDKMRHGEGDSYGNWDNPTNQDFKTKLIEDWVIHLQHFDPIEEIHEVSDSGNDIKRDSSFFNGLDKVEMKGNRGMEAAKRYISSLNASASTAQLANHGLVAIPLLSAFVSLKVLNLSGNCIVRITAGALPRGLHVLNLSKNKISTIEGLRELTRLRVLDLSYNKISRIGHGLASCSTLKELYLAGNKISEVEGLHRLLKLTVIDLRFNKIATSKSLGQLAANYNSLQAISLEGNPAQKNVGDEQLKKYLQGLLPHLAYYNRQHIKTSTLKDSSDRSVRLGISDRALRSDHKSTSRRGSGATKRSSKVQGSELMKNVKGKQVVVPPPSGAKMGNRHRQIGLANKLESLKSGLSLHKSRSESTLPQF